MQEDRSTAGQPVRGASLLSFSLSLSPPSLALSLSSSAGLRVHLLFLEAARESSVPPPAPPPQPPLPFLLPPPSSPHTPWFVLSSSFSFFLVYTHTHIHMRRQTFCLLPVALTIKRWRRRGCAAMFPIPLVSVGNLPPPRGRFASGHPRDEEKSE